MTVRRTTLSVCAALLLSGFAANTGHANPDYFATHTLELTFATEAAGAAEIREYELHYTTDGGQSWTVYPQRHSNADAFPFRAPSDGQYGFRLVAIDAAGQRGHSPQPGDAPTYSCTIDTKPPVVRILRPTAETSLYGGSDLVVEWEVFDANTSERPVTIEWRGSSEQPWRVMSKQGPHPAAGTAQWFATLASGSLELRVTARDLAGNVGQWRTPQPIAIHPFDGFRGSRTLAADPYSGFRRFPMHYRVTGFAPIEVAEVQLWVRPGYGEWRKETDPDRTTPYVFEAPTDGVYFFYFRVISSNGEEDRPAPTSDTPPDYRVVVDTHPPDGELFVGATGASNSHRAGEALDIQWTAHDENLSPHTAKIEVSLDGGRNWQLLKSGLSTENGRGAFTWRPPLIGSESTRLRLVLHDLAGNVNTIDHRSRLRLVNPRVDPRATAEDHYRYAMVLARTKTPDDVGDRTQLRQALEHLETALVYDPNLAAAWHDQGVIQRILGRYQLALGSFQKAHALKPASVPFTFSLVRSYLDMGDQGLDPDGRHLQRASSTLATVSRETIYTYPPGEFRDLLARHRFLDDDVKTRLAEE